MKLEHLRKISNLLMVKREPRDIRHLNIFLIKIYSFGVCKRVQFSSTLGLSPGVVYFYQMCVGLRYIDDWSFILATQEPVWGFS